eukprot:m.260405 g.260405  ORF g.260405 m.260405 type:complete len:372 (-) comp22739_c9_seq1:1511-2626(-)
MHAVEWGRVVLDEAHHIKDRSSSTARAVFNLKARYHWSLSGTPLQNRVGELYSLVKVLKADPYSYYFCRQCECKSLEWKFSSRVCDECGHRSMSHFCWWNREILNPIIKHGTLGPGALAFDNLRKLLLRLMLRRTKIERGSELGLPPRMVFTRRDLLNEEEEDFYESLYSESKTKFVAYVREGTVLNNYAHIFDLLMRMRQAVSHPWLVTHKTSSSSDIDICGICHEEAEDAIVSACKHVFCREDIRMYLNSSYMSSTACPVCFRPLSIDLTQPCLPPQEEKEGAKARSRNFMSRIGADAQLHQNRGFAGGVVHSAEQGPSVKSIVFFFCATRLCAGNHMKFLELDCGLFPDKSSDPELSDLVRDLGGGRG